MKTAWNALSAVVICALSASCAISVPFVPMVHQDGMRTWKITFDLADLKYAPEYRDSPNRDELIAGSFIAHHKFCDAWEITSQREEKKRLIIEGRCK